MGSTDRPGRVEHGDQPLDDVDRIARYEERVNADRADPAKWSKLDPLARLGSGQIERLYRPDPEDPMRPRAVVEGNSVRLIDPAREIPWTAERDEPKPQSDRFGDRVINDEDDEKSLADKVRMGLYKEADSVTDVAKKGADRLQDLLSRPYSTGQAETRADPMVGTQRHDGLQAGSALIGLSLVIAMGYEAARLRMRHSGENREGT